LVVHVCAGDHQGEDNDKQCGAAPDGASHFFLGAMVGELTAAEVDADCIVRRYLAQRQTHRTGEVRQLLGQLTRHPRRFARLDLPRLQSQHRFQRLGDLIELDSPTADKAQRIRRDLPLIHRRQAPADLGDDAADAIIFSDRPPVAFVDLTVGRVLRHEDRAQCREPLFTIQGKGQTLRRAAQKDELIRKVLLDQAQDVERCQRCEIDDFRIDAGFGENA
jgi:hypothetical protein